MRRRYQWQPDTDKVQTGNSDAKADAKRDGGNTARSPAPAMPTVKTPFPHKPRDQHWPLVLAMVARILSPKEAANDPKATAALEAEFEAQRKKRVWEEDKVEEWSTVCSRIRGGGQSCPRRVDIWDRHHQE